MKKVRSMKLEVGSLEIANLKLKMEVFNYETLSAFLYVHKTQKGLVIFFCKLFLENRF